MANKGESYRRNKQAREKNRKAKTLFLRDTDLAERYSVGRTTIWRWASRGLLPAPVQLSESCTRWCLDEIEAFDKEVSNNRRKEQ